MTVTKDIEYAHKSIELGDKESNPQNTMGIAYKGLGNKDKAIECFQKALQIDPKDKTAKAELEGIQ